MQDHVIEGLGDFMSRRQGKSPSLHVWCHRDCDSGDIMVLVCHIYPQDHVIKVVSQVCHYLARLVAICIVVMKILCFQFVT